LRRLYGQSAAGLGLRRWRMDPRRRGPRLRQRPRFSSQQNRQASARG
jgi:hypothetical protein